MSLESLIGMPRDKIMDILLADLAVDKVAMANMYSAYVQKYNEVISGIAQPDSLFEICQRYMQHCANVEVRTKVILDQLDDELLIPHATAHGFVYIYHPTYGAHWIPGHLFSYKEMVVGQFRPDPYPYIMVGGLPTGTYVITTTGSYLVDWEQGSSVIVVQS